MSSTAHRSIPMLTRSSTWWDFKLPPILFLVYLLIPASAVEPTDLLWLMTLSLIVIASAASYGHVVNDIFDIQSDALAGKPNAAASMTTSQQLSYLGLFTISGFLPLLLAQAPFESLGILALIYISVTLYSAPPVRTKERGWLGLLSDAAAAHALPGLLVFSLFGSTPLLADTSYQTAVIAALAWQMCFGLRAILVHQVRDRHCDRQSGTRTLVLSREAGRLQFVAGLLLLVEVAMLLLLLWQFYQVLPTILWFTGIYLAVALFWQVGFRKLHLELLPSAKDARVPLFELYEFFLPFVGVLAVAWHYQEFWFLPFLHVLLFHSRFIRGFKLIGDRLRHILKPE